MLAHRQDGIEGEISAIHGQISGGKGLTHALISTFSTNPEAPTLKISSTGRIRGKNTSSAVVMGKKKDQTQSCTEGAISSVLIATESMRNA